MVFLSDGGDSVRNLQAYLHPDSEHWLDWFHITMRITKRNRWKFDGQRTGREDAALHGLDHFRDMTMAIVESARRMTNADNWPIEHLATVAHRARKGPPQIQAEIRITIVRGSPKR